MTKEAADVLQQFYLQLRKHSSADGSPITARQLESLVRLVEARARLELREEITKQDAKVCGSLEGNYHPTRILCDGSEKSSHV